MNNRFWPALIITPPITMILGYLIAAMITCFMPTRFESTAIIEIVRQDSRMGLTDEIRRLTDPEHLALTSYNLNLADRWGSDESSTIKMLADIVTTEQVPGSRRILIRASGMYPEDARDIVGALIHSSRLIHQGYDLETIKSTLHAFELEITNQEYLVYKLGQEMRENTTFLREPLTETAAESATRYEEESTRLRNMRLRSITHPDSELDASQGGVVVHNPPLVAKFPYTPNVHLNQVIGILFGLILGIPIALGIMKLLHNRYPTATLASLITAASTQRSTTLPPEY
jgi:hypothetical protein